MDARVTLGNMLDLMREQADLKNAPSPPQRHFLSIGLYNVAVAALNVNYYVPTFGFCHPPPFVFLYSFICAMRRRIIIYLSLRLLLCSSCTTWWGPFRLYAFILPTLLLIFLINFSFFFNWILRPNSIGLVLCYFVLHVLLYWS